MMLRTNARGWARIAVVSWFALETSTAVLAQMPASCKGPAELERVIATHPSGGAYDALGAYFGQRQQLSCAVAAFESATRLDPNSWEARFNLALALLQKHETARAARELRIAIRIKPDDPLAHIALGEALGELEQNEAELKSSRLRCSSIPNRQPHWMVWRKL